VAESKKIESEFIPKIATGFCSGISRTCGLCGAVSGGILAISMLFGRSLPEESLDRAYGKVQQFLDQFNTMFGKTNCNDLIGCDLRTEEGQKAYLTNSLFEMCKNYIEEATQMVISIIDSS